MATEELTYRQSIGFMMFDSKKRVFLGKRCWPKDSPYRFQMPQGGIEPGETPEQALWREMYEEIGLTNDQTELVAEAKEWLTYDLPPNMRTSIVGNKQKWFLVYFKGTSQDFVFTHEKHPEFCGARWVAPKKVPYLVIPFKRKVYRQVLNEFKPLIDAFEVPISSPQP
ncbi:MAG: RNA pyrophosphohydrolase [Alphaproteobacteria bacterium]|nr:RNA pyrophosphohydrolase [Alphaproteobacteria bacterium]